MPNVTPVNFKILQAWKPVKIVSQVITKMNSGCRIALGAFPGSTKIKKARLVVKIAR